MSDVELLKKRVEELERKNRDLHQIVADLERSYDITLEALGDALDLKECQTEGHSKRVTAFAIGIARAMGIAPDSLEMRVIARGAFLHDIGKMAIPDAILREPSSLTTEEMAIMRQHPFHGYRTSSKWGPEWCLLEIDDMPFEERKAELERRKYEVRLLQEQKKKERD